MRNKLTAVFAALIFTICVSDISAQIPLFKGSIFGKISGTFTTGDAPFRDATGSYTFGTKQPLAWATTPEGIDYPVSQAIVALSTTKIGASDIEGEAESGGTESIDLGLEGQIYLGMWKDLRLTYQASGEIEFGDPDGEQDTRVGMSIGFVKNFSWDNSKRSGWTIGVTYNTLSRGDIPYAKAELTIGYYLPSLP